MGMIDQAERTRDVEAYDGDCSDVEDAPNKGKNSKNTKPAEVYKLTSEQVSKVNIGDRFDDEQKKRFQQLMMSYLYLFREELEDLQRIAIDPMRIKVDHKVLIKTRYTRILINQLDKLCEEIKILAELRIIVLNTGPYSALLLMIKKKDRTWRLVVDY